ncbi:hypothetical protein N474_25520 [Pseudoalteromonas luteoviolacea CPMOR-2]|uniref:zonular occludens toxin domain-containing protein n=1 Tax=Pseudoalteromonas luteoviolacea TaxID=43657 RepID=UPI0007B0849E|nr:zonular occludens toxin domain-containing protein [Pseudoalteromonas luteoviolacea]KZN58412.1 hypothetical protein N474_25520 [Pseudoalteromonas luteoviolacea CPMOR-2]
MAAHIFHGAPGSFKSASAVWYRLLPALRAGRTCVTNVEGIKTLEQISAILGEEFPESAKLWRISSQLEQGLNLWRNWYHWMPCGAFILMDEVQDIYPSEVRLFKPETCDYKNIMEYEDKIPPDFFIYHIEVLETYKASEDSLTVDDLGQPIYNELGHIIYPRSLKEAYMRHRKYNWDIVCCTPDITAVHSYIRGVCEQAYAFKFFASLKSIKWFKRRTRLHEHKATTNPTTIHKGDTTKFQYIPVEVHQLYKSTATTEFNEGGGFNFLMHPSVAFSVVLIFACLVYFGMWLSGSFDVEENTQGPTVSVENSQQNTGATNHNDAVPVDSHKQPVLTLPYSATDIFVTGSVHEVSDRRTYTNVLFELHSEKFGTVSITNADLLGMGYRTRYLSDCQVIIMQGHAEHVSICKPIDYNKIPLPKEQPEKTEKSLDLGLGLGLDKEEQGV